MHPKRKATVSTPYGAVTVSYRRPELPDDVAAKVEQSTGIELRRMLPDLLSAYLIEWDLTDDDGKPIPINSESLRQLPNDLLWDIAVGVMKSDPSRPMIH